MEGGGADRVGLCLANIPDKQAAALIVNKIPLDQIKLHMEKARDTRLSLEACRNADNGAHSAYETSPRATGRDGGTVIFPEGAPV